MRISGNISRSTLADAKVHDVNILDKLIPEPIQYMLWIAPIWIFNVFITRINARLSFVIRKKTNTSFRRLYSNKVEKSTGVRCDQIILLSGCYSKKVYPEKLRRVNTFERYQ